MTASSPSDPAADHAAIQAALAGDAQARARVAQRLLVVQRLVAAINAHSGAPLAAEEVADVGQDVLAIVWQKLRRFEGVGTLEHWLYRFCLNAFHNHARALSRRARRVTPLPDEPADKNDSDDREIEPSEIELALRELGPPNEEVIRLKHEDGLSFEAVAKALGLTPSTAKTRYYEGVRWLRWRLTRSHGETK